MVRGKKVTSDCCDDVVMYGNRCGNCRKSCVSVVKVCNHTPRRTHGGICIDCGEDLVGE